jgi:TatD DNase family protein
VLIDTHCHLDAAEFDVDRAAVAGAARRAGVDLIVVPAVERANFGAVASVCREFSGCRAAYGIHPMYVDRARDEDLDAAAR